MSLKESQLELLLKENKQLKDQINELKDLIKINKQSIDILSFEKVKNINFDVTLTSQSSKKDQKQLIEVIKYLNNSNSDLTETLFRIQKQKQNLYSRIVLLEQTNSQNQFDFKSKLEQMENQIKKLNQIIITTQQKLDNYELNQIQYSSMTGMIIKYKEVFRTTDSNLKFQQRQQELIQEILILKEEVKILKEQKKKLMSINVGLKNQIIKVKATMLMPNRTLDRIGQISIKKLALYFLQAQRRILNEQNSDDSEYEDDIEFIAPELLILFPDKVQKIKRKKQIPKMPSLNLLKTHQINVSNQNKIKADLKGRNKLKESQQIVKLQQQLEFTRKQFTRLTIQLKQIQQKSRSDQNTINELENRNEKLISAYKQMQNKLKKIKRSYQISKQNQDPNYLNNTLVNGQNTIQFHKIKTKKQIIYPPFFSNKEQFEIQVSNLAHQISKLPYLKNLNNASIRQKTSRQLRRSYSNPFLYIQQRKNLIYDQNPKKFRGNIQVGESCFVRIQRTQDESGKYHQDLDNIAL